MPSYDIEIPGQGTFKVDSPTELTDQQAYDAVLAQLQQPSERKAEDVGFIEGIGAAGKRGLASLGEIASGLGLAGTAVTGTEEETRRKMQAIKEQQAQPEAVPGTRFADLERIYQEQGLGAALKEVPKYTAEQIVQNIPQMAGPLAAGAAASPFLTPVGGALVGMGVYGVQQFGSFLVRQAAEKEDPKELEVAKAALTAAGTAPLGYLADRFTVGLGSLGKTAGKEIIQELAKRKGIDLAGGVAKQVGKGVTAGIIAEAPTEVLEQAAERYQAGLALTGDDAYNEYKEALFGAIAAGGGIKGITTGAEVGLGVRKERREGGPELQVPEGFVPGMPPEAPQTAAGAIEQPAYTPAPIEELMARREARIAQAEQDRLDAIQAEIAASRAAKAGPTAEQVAQQLQAASLEGTGQVSVSPLEEAAAEAQRRQAAVTEATTVQAPEVEVRAAVDTAMRSIEQNNGVATLAQANLLDRYFPQQKMYDRIATPIEEEAIAGEIITPETKSPRETVRMGERVDESQEAWEKLQADREQRQREVLREEPVAEEVVKPAPEAVTEAMQTPAFQQTPEQRLTLQAAQRTYTPSQMEALQTPPFARTAAQKISVQGLTSRVQSNVDSTVDQANAGDQNAKFSIRDAGGEFSPEMQDKANEIRRELVPALQRFGLQGVALKLVDSINNGTADGAYFRNVIQVALDSDKPMLTLRHEVIHALKKTGAFTNEEWALLEKKAREQWINQYFSKDMQQAYLDQYLADNNGNPEGFESYMAEEAIAEAFKNFEQTGKAPAGRIGNIFRRIKEMLGKMRDFFTKRGLTTDQIFQGIERGEYAPAYGGAEVAPAYQARPAARPKFAKRDLKTREGIIADGIDRVAAAMVKHSADYSGRMSEFGRGWSAMDRIEEGIISRLEAIGDKDAYSTLFNEIRPYAVQKMREHREATGTRFSLKDRQYKLQIEREKRKMAKTANLTDAEQELVIQDAEKLGLSEAQVDGIIDAIKNDKRRFPASQGWADLEVAGVSQKTDEDGNPVPGTEAPMYKARAYAFNRRPGIERAPQKMDVEWRDKVAKEFTNLITDIYKRAEKGDQNAKNIIAHQSWYKSVAATLRKEYGAFGDLLSDLLGATSPNTPVDTNWRFSIDVMRRFVRGDFNAEMQAFVNWLEAGKPVSKFPAADKIRQISGKLYGMNSANAMKALADVWRSIEPGSAPKARNFALNLIGQSNIATIDVWAARMIRRAANEVAKGEYKRIPPPAETGVSGTWNAKGDGITGEFGFGASVMDKVSKDLKKKGIDIAPPDLQAIAWFAEKELWGTKGWTTKAGEGGSFEENIDKFPVERYIAGHSVQQGEAPPSVESIKQAQEQVLTTLANDPSVVAMRVMETKGLYGGTVEASFDTEWVAEKGQFDPINVVSDIAQASQKENQYDFFVSKVIGAEEENPNARPGVEVYFRNKLALDNVMPILSKFTARGQDGFTLAVDPRLNNEQGQYIGVRLQYVPEISMRWDEDLRNILTTPEGLDAALKEKAAILNTVVAELSTLSEVAYTARVNYDTVVVGKENYDDYISPAVTARNIASGRAVWFGQPVRAAVEAAARRYSAARRQVDERGVEYTGDEGGARYSLRPDERGGVSDRELPQGRSGEVRGQVSYGSPTEGSVTVDGVHYSRQPRETLDSKYHGTGLSGAERQRLAYAEDPRINRRIYFYADKGRGIKPEAGVGIHPHNVRLNNIYDANTNRAIQNTVDKSLKGGEWSNAFESAVIDAGYDGYVSDFGNQRAIVLLGDHAINMEPAKYSLRLPEKLVPVVQRNANFKRWFGNSKVVDENGKPKVMYHGTARDITQFSPKQANAIFVTEDPSFAEDFTTASLDYIAAEYYDNLPEAEKRKLVNSAVRSLVKDESITKEAGKNLLEKYKDDIATAYRPLRMVINPMIYDKLTTGQNIMPVYVRAENPFDFANPEHVRDVGMQMAFNVRDAGGVANPVLWAEDLARTTADGSWEVIEKPDVQQAIRDAGFDGFYVMEGGRKNLGVYNPNQIKSASANVGSYNDKGDIRYSFRGQTLDRLTKLGDERTAGQKIKEAVTEAHDNFGNRSWRVSWIDVSDSLGKSLSSLPIFDKDGRLRADYLTHTKFQTINLVKNGLVSGIPVVNSDGSVVINRSDNNLARAQLIADQIDTNKFAVEQGMSGRQLVAEVARILRGKDILEEDKQLRAKSEKQLRDATALFKMARQRVEDGTISAKEYRNTLKVVANLRKEGYKNRNINRERLVSDAHIAFAEHIYNSVPEVRQVLDIFREVNHGLVNLWEQAGILTKEQADEYRSNKHYVPFLKSAEDLDESAVQGFGMTGGKGAKSTPKMKKLKGGEHRVNIWENVSKQYAKMTALGIENQTRATAASQLVGLGLAFETNPSDDRTNLRYRRDGKEVHIVAENPLDVAAFQSMNYQLNPVMKYFFGGATKALRWGALVNPMFWLRQIIRDPMHASMTTDAMVTPLHSASNFVGMLFGKDREAVDILSARGVLGEFGTTMNIHDFLETVGKDTGKKRGKIGDAIHKVMQIHEAADAATRVAIYKQAYEKAKKQGYSDERAQDIAVFKARESINFSVQGNSPMLANLRQMIPFLSATITSLDTLYRAMRGINLSPEDAAAAKRIFWSRAMMMVALSTVYAMMYSGDDDYEEVPDYEKDNNWLIPIPSSTDPNKKSFISIPAPFEVGFLFKTLPEVFVRYLTGTSTGKEAVASIQTGLIHNMPTGGVPIPQAVRPALEVITNHSFFTGNPIEGMNDQRKPTHMRGDRASETAKLLSKYGLDTIGLSPANIDHLMRGYFAEYGTLFFNLTDSAIYGITGETPPSKILENEPFIKNFMTDPTVQRSVSVFYDLERQANQTYTEFNEMKKIGNAEEINAILTDPEKRAAVIAQDPLNKIGNAMTKINAEMKRIEDAPNMTADQKRDLINYYKSMKADLARQGVAVAKQVGLTH